MYRHKPWTPHRGSLSDGKRRKHPISSSNSDAERNTRNEVIKNMHSNSYRTSFNVCNFQTKTMLNNLFKRELPEGGSVFRMIRISWMSADHSQRTAADHEHSPPGWCAWMWPVGRRRVGEPLENINQTNPPYWIELK